MEKIPVHIISGFLGAGKTTTIIELFRQKTTEESWAVIINEFGKIPIDSQTLRASSPSGTVFDIAGGCICCTAKGYLNERLEEIIQSGLYSRILIEPSGLGGIDMVSEMVETKNTLFLKPVICLVDVTGIEIPRLQRNPVYQRQITRSDVVVFTKTDLIESESKRYELIQHFNATFPQANIDRKFSIEPTLLDLDFSVKETKRLGKAFTLFDPTLSATNYLQKNCIFKADTILDTEKIKRMLLKHTSIIRAKGYLRTELGWMLLNYTLTDCHFERCNTCAQNEIVLIYENTQR
ncbi:MAG: hypothetical protein NTY32_12870 [Bacteroidia bacterium]|nr:hypothetical protein [Bacteroidia bacterium]